MAKYGGEAEKASWSKGETTVVPQLPPWRKCVRAISLCCLSASFRCGSVFKPTTYFVGFLFTASFLLNHSRLDQSSTVGVGPVCEDCDSGEQGLRCMQSSCPGQGCLCPEEGLPERGGRGS